MGGAGGVREFGDGRVGRLREAAVEFLGQGEGIEPFPGQGGEVGEADVLVAGGHGEGVGAGADDGAGLGGGGPVGDLHGADRQQVVAAREQRRAEVVAAAPERGGAHQRVEFGGGPAPVEHTAPGQAVVPAVVGTQAPVLGRAGGRSGGQFVDEFGEGLDARLEAGDVEVVHRGRRVDGHRALLEHVAGVGLQAHHVPGDTVLLVAVEDGPAGGEQTRVPGQRTVVEVDGQPGGQGEHLLRKHPEVGDAEQVVEAERGQPLGEVRVERHGGQPLLPGPVEELGGRGHHGGHRVSAGHEQPGALDEEGLLADHDTAERLGSHRRPPSDCPRWGSSSASSSSTAASDRPATRRSASPAGAGPVSAGVVGWGAVG